MKNPCKVRGFDGRQAVPITHYIKLTLELDGRCVHIPMLIVSLGDHDMILGRKWFAATGVLIDCRHRKLVWPPGCPRGTSWSRVLATTQEILEHPAKDPNYQRDANRRDRLIATTETYRPQILKRQTPATNICGISAVAFKMNLQKKENEAFVTSLYEISRELEASQAPDLAPEEAPASLQQPYETELQWLGRILPVELRDYADVVSREASNVLPPHRPYDHKIRLDSSDGPRAIGYSLLRHQSTLELQETKWFLEENLQRGFIEPSQASFASPILFVRKPSGALCFCIDYRRLNNLTCKDRYPLPLISETLARISRAQVYTKLDI